MAKGGGNKKRFQYCTDLSGQEILNLRDLQNQSGRNPIDPSLQDNVLIPNNFFDYISHIGCAVSLHSITNSGLIAGGQNSSRERQTVFFTAVNPNKSHKDLHWVDIQLAQQIKLKFYQKRSNASILHDTLPAYYISKVVVTKSGEIMLSEGICVKSTITENFL